MIDAKRAGANNDTLQCDVFESSEDAISNSKEKPNLNEQLSIKVHQCIKDVSSTFVKPKDISN
jgi:hypothetical protein